MHTDNISILLLVTGLLLVVRSLNAYFLTTFFQPDEYFQSLEPAWQLAFGQETGAWITWEWHEQLRSAIHPVLFAGVYKAVNSISDLFALDTISRAEVLILAPKILQICIATLIDLYTVRLSQVVYGANSQEAIATLLLSIWSPWQWYCSTRTFSNTLEALLTIMALTYWPWRWMLSKTGGSSMQGTTIAFGLAALACILRPTNVLIWISILVTTFSRYGSYEKARKLVSKSIIAGTTVLTASVLIDRAYYGHWTLPQLRFLYFNAVQSLSVFYGRNRLDYYFTEGLPLLLTTALPFGVVGWWQAIRPGLDKPDLIGYFQRQTRFLLATAVAVAILAFSSIAHKEVRFLYPLLPILHVLAARPIARYFQLFPVQHNMIPVAVLITGLTINLYIMAYTSLIHQRGVIDVMHHLRHESEMLGNITVGFLMPCHSTPWRSHLVHPQIEAWALTCEPPLKVPMEWRDDYLDEADVFYNHPGDWIDNNLVDRNSVLRSREFIRPVAKEGQRQWPDYLVFFEHLEPVMNMVTDRTRYSEQTRFFNTHWHDDWRRRGDVVVHKLDKPS